MSDSQMVRVFITDGTLIRGVHTPAGETVELPQGDAAELVAAGRAQWEEGVLAARRRRPARDGCAGLNAAHGRE
jgi:hypothetical protein